MTSEVDQEAQRQPGRLRRWAKGLKQHIGMCLVAMSHPAVGWPARTVLAVTLTYAVSPIDLIPDFIPILGLLDDLILVPLGLWLAIRMIPASVVTECRQRVSEGSRVTASSRMRVLGFLLVVMMWMVSACALYALLYR